FGFFIWGATPRHCQRSKAIHREDGTVWIASGFALAMTKAHAATRIRGLITPSFRQRALRSLITTARPGGPGPVIASRAKQSTAGTALSGLLWASPSQ
ncbi:MAG: hypothetical protein LBC51_01410, partial [Treponema sp.]|nr:hypothetical protein [Treponema sp.]